MRLLRATSLVRGHAPGQLSSCACCGRSARTRGLLLAGAVAYYTLLSIVPLLILVVIALSRIIDQGELLATLGRYLEWLIPGQSTPVVGRAGPLPRPSPSDRLGAARHDGVLQHARIHRSGKRDVGHLPRTGSSFAGATSSFPRSFRTATSSFLAMGLLLTTRRLGRAPGHRGGKHRVPRTRLVAARSFAARCSTCWESPARSSC